MPLARRSAAADFSAAATRLDEGRIHWRTSFQSPVASDGQGGHLGHGAVFGGRNWAGLLRSGRAVDRRAVRVQPGHSLTCSTSGSSLDCQGVDHLFQDVV